MFVTFQLCILFLRPRAGLESKKTGLLDNGNKGLRVEVMVIIEDYMMDNYLGLDKAKLVYKKYEM